VTHSLPDPEVMYRALVKKDSNFEGIFIVGVRTTGVFCRPTCTARKPKKENTEYFASPREALLEGYRPCRICRPMEPEGESPGWLAPLLEEIEKNPDTRFTDSDLRDRGLDPNRVRRWFKKHHGMTFQSFLRTMRIGNAFGRIKNGDKVIEAAYGSGYESLSGFTESFKKVTGFAPVKSTQHELVKVTRIPTPLGPMLAGATGEGICLLEFVDRRMLETQLRRIRKAFKAELVPGASGHFDDLKSQLMEYFEGGRKDFTVPLVLTGTPFQKKVWSILRTIPYGSTRSYKEQAKLIGNPNAVRAVARANGDNKIAIIIPCHRVIGASGDLVGYGGGLWRKRYLLNLEQSPHDEKEKPVTDQAVFRS